jgi:hypothetical protein
LDAIPLAARDAGGQFGRQQAVVRRLDGKLPDGRDPDIDRDGPETAGLKGDAPSVHCGLGKARPGFLAVPRDEFI